MFNKTKKNLRNKKGFTLIELVVVIAVIGILAAIAIPRVTGITTNAKEKAKKQHIAIINSALERYKAEEAIDDIVTSASTPAKTNEKVFADEAAILAELKTEKYLTDDVTLTIPGTTTTLTFNFTDDKFE